MVTIVLLSIFMHEYFYRAETALTILGLFTTIIISVIIIISIIITSIIIIIIIISIIISIILIFI